MNTAETVAAGIAARYDLDLRALTRGGGWTNAVFLSDTLVIRVAPDQGSGRIGREAALAKWLPPQAGVPEVVEYGRTDGHEWSVSRRIPGETLGDVWPSMDWAQKTEILRQMWEIAEAIHRVDIGPLRASLPQRAWYSSLEKRESLGLLEALVEKGLLSREQAAGLVPYLDRFYEALPHAPLVLCHGDLTLENVMVHEGRVAALLDFEHAALAPHQLDTNILLRHCFGPESAEDAGENRDEGRARFLQAAEVLARSKIPDQRSLDVLCGFSILQALRRVEIWFENAGDAGAFAGWEPYRSAMAFLEVDGGYYGRLGRG